MSSRGPYRKTQPSSEELDYMERLAKAVIAQRPGLTLDRLSMAVGLSMTVTRSGRLLPSSALKTLIQRLEQSESIQIVDHKHANRFDHPHVFPAGYKVPEAIAGRKSA